MARTFVQDQIYIEINLAYPDGTSKTVVQHSHTRPWAEDGVLYVSIESKRIGWPMIHVRSFRSEYVNMRDEA